MADPIIIFLNVILIGTLVFVHYRRLGNPSALAPFYFLSLLYKVGLGIALGLIYFFYYQGGDTIHLFEDGVKMAKVAQENPVQYFRTLFLDENLPAGIHYGQQPRALFFAKMISGFAWLTGHHYWLTSVYFSLISFFAIWYLCTLLVRYFQHSTATAVAFLLYPSVAFWSAGIIKESIAMALICMIIAFTLRWIKQKNALSVQFIIVALFLLCAIILWKLKYYYVAVLLPVVFSVVLLYHSKAKPVTQFILMILVLAVALLGVSSLHPNLHLSYILQVLATNHDLIFQASQQEDVVIYQQLEPNWQSFFQNLPLALFSGLFRPLPGDGSTWLHFMNGLENLALMSIAFFSLCSLTLKRIGIRERLLVGSVAVYVVVLSVLLALSSPNFGTLMRYKVVYLPFLLYLGLVASQPLLDLIKERFFAKSQFE